MKNKKRLLSLLIWALLLAAVPSVLSGCGGNSGSANQNFTLKGSNS